MMYDNYFLLTKCIDSIALRVDNFKPKGNNLYNFRCNICGDSKYNKTKARAFIYYQQNSFYFKCHNCSISMSLVNYMKEYFPDIYSEYQFEKIKDYKNASTRLDNSNSNRNFSISSSSVVCGNVRQRRRLLDDLLDSIDKLPKDHDAVKYLETRKIPIDYYSELYYIDDVTKIHQLSQKNKEKFKYIEPRILIPIWSKALKLVGFYCRDIGGESKLKYLTVRINEQEEMIYGMDKVDASKLVYVVEGQFDSMFLDNAIAVGTSDLRRGAQFFPKENVVLIPDAQPRNEEICKLINKFIKGSDYKVCLLPSEKIGKDINSFIMNGGTKDELMTIIKEHTYSGLKAQLEFAKWKKI